MSRSYRVAYLARGLAGLRKPGLVPRGWLGDRPCGVASASALHLDGGGDGVETVNWWQKASSGILGVCRDNFSKVGGHSSCP